MSTFALRMSEQECEGRFCLIQNEEESKDVLCQNPA